MKLKEEHTLLYEGNVSDMCSRNYALQRLQMHLVIAPSSVICVQGLPVWEKQAMSLTRAVLSSSFRKYCSWNGV